MTKSEQSKGKKDMVQSMFNDIASKYDLLNHCLSANIDRRWRRRLRKQLAVDNPKVILDVASGTGDLAIELAKMPVEKIVGIDIAADMLEIGHKKIRKLGLDRIIQLQVGDSEAISFEDGSFDAVTVSFGVRNYEDLGKGLQEMQRVLKPGGKVAVLEFSRPSAFPMKNIYWCYFKYVLPVIGKIVTRNISAYDYLPDSVAVFPEGKVFMDELLRAGFKNPTQNRLTFGIATLYIAEK